MLLSKKPLATLNTVKIFSKYLYHNLAVIEKAAKGKHLFPVLKSNAYGHGITEVATILKDYRTPYLAVDSYFEALEIWKVKKRPVLILGSNPPENISHFKWKYLTLCVSNFPTLEAILTLKKKIKIHLFINTGMNREGFSPDDIPEVLEKIKDSKIELEGVLSHFASADDGKSPQNNKQEKVFSKCLDYIDSKGFSPKYIHLSNSAACPRKTDRRINACRPGIATYGINPLPSSHLDFKKLEKLKPVMCIFSIVTNIQKIKKGEKVSYNGAFTAQKKMEIGILSIGYQEFLDRRLSNAHIFTKGKKEFPLIGRVCMNITCCDISGKKIQIGEKIQVLSEKKNAPNSAENIAKKIKTIPYEVLTGVDASMRRTIIS